MLSLPRVTRNSSEITTEKATVPNTTKLSPFSANASTTEGTLCTLGLLLIEPLSATLEHTLTDQSIYFLRHP